MNSSTLSDRDRYLAGTSMVMISSLGLALNLSIFFKFADRKQLLNAFYVLCFSKSISNSIICLINLLWIGPAILLTNLFLPILVNQFLGQLNEYGIYMMGPLTQVSMGLDRFFVIFLPLKMSDQKRCSISTWGIFVSWLMSVVFVAYSYPNDCWVFFSLEDLNYKTYNTSCDDRNIDIVFLLCIVLALISSIIQVSNFIKLLIRASKKRSTQNSSSNRRRTIRLFAQSVIQDFLHCLDVLNSRDLFHVTTSTGSFFTYTFSLVFVHAVDGFIMCLFHLKWPCSKKNKTAVTRTFSVSSARKVT